MPKIGHRSAKTQQRFPKSNTIVRNRTLGAKIGHQSQKSDTFHQHLHVPLTVAPRQRP